MPGSIPFIPGVFPATPGPLARYLPPVPDGVVTAWLRQYLPTGEAERPWILDPFGALPRLAVEAARAGYRVLVAANNPVARFLLEMAANPPTEADLRAALAELAAAHKGDERIEPHIRSLYTTECARCGQAVMAEAFLWERGATAPFGRFYTCPHCDDHGERPTSQADIERASHYTSAGLHWSRALERVAPLNDHDREHAEEAISVYLPRAVYALFTLINKLDGLSLPLVRRDHLNALLLTACDQGNSLWAYPTARERPRQLTTPPRFRENNVWLALEEGIHLWAGTASQASLTLWPNQPPADGGVCIFEGRSKDLDSVLSQIPIGAVVTALPRPNQAFWTLCALWAGWLWGRQAVGPFISVLRRRRYDWAWHTTALHAAMSHLVTQLSPDRPFYGLIGAVEPGFLTAALIAADEAGFDLDGLALRAENNPAQFLWRYKGTTSNEVGYSGRMSRVGLAAVSAYLRERGEPADYLHMVAAALSGMTEHHLFRRAQAVQAGNLQTSEQATEPTSAEHFSQTQAALKEILTYRGGFFRYGATESIETGQWWLREVERDIQPLADRVEMAVVSHLIQNPGSTLAELDGAICEAFPGLLTPDSELVHVCLESYGEQDSPDSNHWQLRPQDAPAMRYAELETVLEQLERLAERLGLEARSTTAQDATTVRWVDTEAKIHYWFFPRTTALLGSLVQSSDFPASQTLIVIPGGRANLVAFKLRRDPRLNQAVQQGLRFLKFRHLRWLMETPLLTPENLEEELNADPLTYTAPQMRLL